MTPDEREKRKAELKAEISELNKKEKEDKEPKISADKRNIITSYAIRKRLRDDKYKISFGNMGINASLFGFCAAIVFYIISRVVFTQVLHYGAVWPALIIAVVFFLVGTRVSFILMNKKKKPELDKYKKEIELMDIELEELEEQYIKLGGTKEELKAEVQKDNAAWDKEQSQKAHAFAEQREKERKAENPKYNVYDENNKHIGTIEKE